MVRFRNIQVNNEHIKTVGKNNSQSFADKLKKKSFRKYTKLELFVCFGTNGKYY